MFRQRRIIVNDDGLARVGDENGIMEQRLMRAVNTQVDSYFLCVGQTSTGSAPGAEGVPGLDNTQAWWFSDTKPAGLDELTIGYLKAAREAGMEIFASFRMNDIHDAWSGPLQYPLKVERPDLLIGEKQSYPQDAVLGAFWSGFDYAKEEVREHFRDFIISYCREYDYDGVELDYFRHPLFFKLGEEEENLETMTEFVHQVRQGLNEISRERGKPYLLAARVPDDLNICVMTGLDVEQWLKEGLLDLLIVGGGYMPYAGRLKQLIDLAHEYDVPAYPCVNHFATPIERRSIASNFWALGADGVYLFNYPEMEAQCLNEIGDPDILLGLDRQYLPDNGCSISYCGHTNPSGQFPVRLIDGTPIELVVGDDVQRATHEGILEEMRLEVKIGNMDEGEGIVIKINGVSAPRENIERADMDTFDAVVTAPPVRQGINEIVVLPGRHSVGRLSSTVTGLELQVRYR